MGPLRSPPGRALINGGLHLGLTAGQNPDRCQRRKSHDPEQQHDDQRERVATAAGLAAPRQAEPRNESVPCAYLVSLGGPEACATGAFHGSRLSVRGPTVVSVDCPCAAGSLLSTPSAPATTEPRRGR